MSRLALARETTTQSFKFHLINAPSAKVGKTISFVASQNIDNRYRCLWTFILLMFSCERARNYPTFKWWPSVWALPRPNSFSGCPIHQKVTLFPRDVDSGLGYIICVLSIFPKSLNKGSKSGREWPVLNRVSKVLQQYYSSGTSLRPAEFFLCESIRRKTIRPFLKRWPPVGSSSRRHLFNWNPPK